MIKFWWTLHRISFFLRAVRVTSSVLWTSSWGSWSCGSAKSAGWRSFARSPCSSAFAFVKHIWVWRPERNPRSGMLCACKTARAYTCVYHFFLLISPFSHCHLKQSLATCLTFLCPEFQMKGRKLKNKLVNILMPAKTISHAFIVLLLYKRSQQCYRWSCNLFVFEISRKKLERTSWLRGVKPS